MSPSIRRRMLVAVVAAVVLGAAGGGAGAAAVTASGRGAAAATAGDPPAPSRVIAVPPQPQSAAATHDGSGVWVSSFDSQSIELISTATGQVTRTIPVGFRPDKILVSPDSATLYVHNDGDAYVSIDVATGEEVHRIPADGYSEPAALSPDGSLLYMPLVVRKELAVADTLTGAITAAMSTDDYPVAVALSPDGSRAYVVTLNGSVDVFDTATRQLTHRTPPPQGGGREIAASPDGTTVAVSHGDGTVSLIDATTLAAAATIVTGLPEAWGLAFSADGSRLIVTGGTGVTSIDTATGSVLVMVDLPDSYAFHLAVVPDGSSVYVTDSANARVVVFDAPAISTGTLRAATVGLPYDESLNAASTFGSVVYDPTGLPDGLVIDSATGRISGTPTTAGTHSVSVTAANGVGSATVTLALDISESPGESGTANGDTGNGQPDDAEGGGDTLAASGSTFGGTGFAAAILLLLAGIILLVTPRTRES